MIPWGEVLAGRLAGEKQTQTSQRNGQTSREATDGGYFDLSLTGKGLLVYGLARR